jgi:hypothetical protein
LPSNQDEAEDSAIENLTERWHQINESDIQKSTSQSNKKFPESVTEPSFVSTSIKSYLVMVNTFF